MEKVADHEEVNKTTTSEQDPQRHEAATSAAVNDDVAQNHHVAEEEGEEEAEDHEAAAAEVEEEDEAEVEIEEEVSQKLHLGGQEFADTRAVSGYLSKALQTAAIDEKLAEEKARVLLDLLEKHHPKAQEKIAAGLAGVVVRMHPAHATRCFFVVRKDGTEEDFSFRKCLDNIVSGKR